MATATKVDAATLVRLRDRVKASLTKMEASIEKKDELSVIQIDEKLEKVEKLVSEFISYDDILGGCENYMSEFDEFEDRVEALKSILLKEKEKRMKIDRAESRRSLTSSNEDLDKTTLPNMPKTSADSTLIAILNELTKNQSQVSTSINQLTNVPSRNASSDTYLPKIQIKVFNGNYKDWPTFKDQYETLVHNDDRLNEIQKFTHLRQFLGPEPLLLIQNMLVTKQNYENAWNKLKKRYENKRKIASSYMEEFFNQKAAKEGTAEEIRSICDSVENILAGLDSIDASANCRDIWLIHILLNKLDVNTRQSWAEKLNENYEADVSDRRIFPSIGEFVTFLDARRATLESIEDQNQYKKKFNNKVKSHFINSQVNKNSSCLICKLSNHTLHKCIKFKQLPILERRSFISKNLLCFKCLNSGHKAKKCKYDKVCSACGKNHHSLLHINEVSHEPNVSKSEGSSNTSLSQAQYQVAKPSTSTNVVIHENNKRNLRVCDAGSQSNTGNTYLTERNDYVCNLSNGGAALLPTAQVKVSSPNGGFSVNSKVLLDSGSQVPFISKELIQALKLKRRKSQITVSGLSSTGSVSTQGIVDIKLCSKNDDAQIIIEAYVLDKISNYVPAIKVNMNGKSQYEDRILADDTFDIPSKIDILLGADYFFKVLKEGIIYGRNGCPSLINTVFGWVVAGNVHGENVASANSFNVEVKDYRNIDDSLKKFWELENIPNDEKIMSEEEEFCEKHFKNNTKIGSDGKFIVALLFRPKSMQLGNSINGAQKRLERLEIKLSKNENYEYEYKSFMKEYIEMNHMKVISSKQIRTDIKDSYYLAHHAVIKPESLTTKCRVVFDGSSKTSTGVSLNDNLAVGATIQRDIQSILLNFRLYKIALCGDIEKMYRQVWIREEDQGFQRILWRQNSSEEIKHFKLCTVTYGTSSAPFLATRSLREVGELYKLSNPEASKAIIEDFYVDDLISGASTEEDAIKIRNEISVLLQQHGFPIRKWVSNSKFVLSSISNDKLASSLIGINENKDTIKVLGLQWQAENDYFTFKVKLSTDVQCTKRSILSEASKIFDPLGFLSPSIIMFKVLFQELWLKKYDWDDLVSEEIKSKWFHIRNSLVKFEDLRITRWMFTSIGQIELIGFSDASETAYSAVMYLRAIDGVGQVNVNLLMAKTKVAPLKKISIPRLELCGAWLLMKIYKFVMSSLKFQEVPVTAFTDSSVVLSWLASHPAKWKPFVAFKTSQIIEVLPATKWKYITSKNNPADCASRGISPEKLLNHSLWWHGPEWLMYPKENWPNCNIKVCKQDIEDEARNKSIYSYQVTNESTTIEDLFTKFSSLSKILRIISYCKRLHKRTYKYNFITTEELQDALLTCIKYIQLQHFTQDIHSIRSGKPVEKGSKLRSFNPILDKQGILRIGGRLNKADCSYNAKHPIIIPKQHPIATLIIREHHVKHFHAGATLLMNILRQQFWIIGLRILVKKEIHKCIACIKFKATACDQLMADLPFQRVSASKPFTFTGIDYAGPFSIRWNKGRFAKIDKAYLAIFVCFSSKAAHLELVSDMTTETFIAALKRFIGRRGAPNTIYSDHGSNFIGAKRKLSMSYDTSLDSNVIGHFLTSQSIKWHMIPPNAPHQGGIWEACVKSAKIHLKKVIGNQVLTFEELATLFVQIEAQLNSRPLTPLYDNDADNIDVLTPGHFLIGSGITALPDPDLTNAKIPVRDRWLIITKAQQDFWKR